MVLLSLDVFIVTGVDYVYLICNQFIIPILRRHSPSHRPMSTQHTHHQPYQPPILPLGIEINKIVNLDTSGLHICRSQQGYCETSST